MTCLKCRWINDLTSAFMFLCLQHLVSLISKPISIHLIAMKLVMSTSRHSSRFFVWSKLTLYLSRGSEPCNSFPPILINSLIRIYYYETLLTFINSRIAIKLDVYELFVIPQVFIFILEKNLSSPWTWPSIL